VFSIYLRLKLQLLPSQVRDSQRDWQPSAVIIDASPTEIAAVKTAFGLGMKLFLCCWHVQRAWQKQLVAKVIETVASFIFCCT
jgi:hypothetical protein